MLVGLVDAARKGPINHVSDEKAVSQLYWRVAPNSGMVLFGFHKVGWRGKLPKTRAVLHPYFTAPNLFLVKLGGGEAASLPEAAQRTLGH